MDIQEASEIVNGFKNLIKSKLLLTSKEENELFQLRMNVCDLCKYKSEEQICNKCGCYLPAKTKSSKSKCPINLW